MTITISDEWGKKIAQELLRGDDGSLMKRTDLLPEWQEIMDLLDPPLQPLWDEIYTALQDQAAKDDWSIERMTNTVASVLYAQAQRIYSDHRHDVGQAFRDLYGMIAQAAER